MRCNVPLTYSSQKHYDQKAAKMNTAITGPLTIQLTDRQRRQYEKEGYVVIRNAIPSADLTRFDAAIDRHVPHDAYAPGKSYPEPAKYTLSQQVLGDPELARVAEHPVVVDAVEQLLGTSAHLTAYVIYVRTPGDQGSLAHNDYKRWRPVGSSMDWLFTVIPLTDFDAAHGPLLVAPGSHQLDKVSQLDERFWHRERPVPPNPTDFIDPQLRRGDLLLMNMYLWHQAPPNQQHRCGIFNKYAASDAPPATGYYLYNSAVYSAFSERGRRLLAVHADVTLKATRALITHGDAVLLVEDQEGYLALPGGEGWEEDVIPGWDHGNRVGALDAALQGYGLDLPWLSYVGDFAEAGALTRVYGFPIADRPPITVVHRWCDDADLSILLAAERLQQEYTLEALREWCRKDIRRGKALSQARAKADQYAA